MLLLQNEVKAAQRWQSGAARPPLSLSRFSAPPSFQVLARACSGVCLELLLVFGALLLVRSCCSCLGLLLVSVKRVVRA